MAFTIAEPWSLTGPQQPNLRDSLVRFWLSAPVDAVEQLCRAQFGAQTVALIRELNANTSFNPDQIALRDAINQRLHQGGLQQPMGPQLLLAVFLYSPVGLMQIANPEQNLPVWLNDFYQKVYGNAAAVQPPAPPAPPSLSEQEPSAPDFGPFPSSLQDLVGNRIHLNRILGLSNLYYIDPEDREICSELQEVRSALAELIRTAPEASLEQVWAGDFGDRYWAMVRSGIQNEPLEPADQQRRDAAAQALNPNQGGGFNRRGAINAILVAMLYFAPGTMQVNNSEAQLPGWLYPNYKQIFADALQQSPA